MAVETVETGFEAQAKERNNPDLAKEVNLLSRISRTRLSVANFKNILRAAFGPIFLHQKLQSQSVTRANTFVQKGGCKMLIKLTPVVNFNNIL